MKILSMTATFGKLNNQTLTLQPDMNIIEAPNEWGKSTWCAFVMAMLYGIDTGSRTKTGFLADKEHYAPWSGAPMSGTMHILWGDRAITLQRQNKGRTPMGEVKAFETETGIPVPELEIPAPGQVLLGVERSVFARAGFIKLADMPVTEDESLRRRLNALVTTGDESDASDDLAQKLKDLKNRCRFNKKGRLPELETQQAEILQRLQQIHTLQTQIETVSQQETTLVQQIRALENHKQALEYTAHLQYAQKLAAAQLNRDNTEKACEQARQICENLPTQEEIRKKLDALQQHRQTQNALHTKVQLLPPLPQPPVGLEPFRGKDPAQAVADATEDFQNRNTLSGKQKQTLLTVLGIAGMVLGAVLLLLSPIAGAPILAAGAVATVLAFTKKQKIKAEIAMICDRYRGISPDRWVQEATVYANAQVAYAQAVEARQQALAQINAQLEASDTAIAQITGGQNIAGFEEQCREQLQAYAHWQDLQRQYQQAQDVLQALSGAGKEVAPPAFTDTLTLTPEQTEQQLSDSNLRQQLLRQRLGQLQGQMESLGQPEHLQVQATQIQSRIAKLEQYYRALTRAQEALVAATQELQRRFAPRISQLARDLFARMTGQRYDKLILKQDLSVDTGTTEETTQWSALWRSDGTVDQLYLALRLAVAEELTPTAPLVLDDALVRFDDTRLAETLHILQEESTEKQVILFTCQSREKQIRKEETL